MVIRWRPLLSVAIAAGLLGGSSCKVLVEDNCANQAVPGNQFCRELYDDAAPYCSPCRRELHGCVQSPPYACQGYYDEIGEDEQDDGPLTDEGGSSSGEAPEGSTSSSTGAATDGSDSGSSDGSGSGGSDSTGGTEG